jgi:hypothetical protein
MKKMFLMAASAAMIAIPLAGPAAADEAAICETGVIVHEGPSYGTNPVYVETGKYEPYTTCLQDPPIVVSPLGICTVKPKICV